jgi:DNA polymerase-3 subunit alpha/error-prone DNA polymerase
LIQAGALDSLAPGQDPALLRWRLARWQKNQARRLAPARETGFFPEEPPAPAPILPTGREIERLRRQFNVLGFLVDRHPIVLFGKTLAGKGLTKAADLNRCMGRRVRMAGWLITAKVVTTHKGDPMRFVTFEDETGVVEATLFPAVHRRFCHMLDWGRPYLLWGKVEENFGVATLTVDRIAQVQSM